MNEYDNIFIHSEGRSVFMARVFNVREREEIRNVLIEKGRDLFSRTGLKRTSVEELTRAAGISSGSFYSFFGSKEELYFEIVELEERYRDEVIGDLLKGGELTQTKFAAFLERVFMTMEENPIIRQLYEEGVYEQLMRKLPPERIETHIRKDSEAFKQLLGAWQAEGRIVDEDLEVLAGLFRALFFMTFHRQEIGENVYPQVRTLLLQMVSKKLIVQTQNEKEISE